MLHRMIRRAQNHSEVTHGYEMCTMCGPLFRPFEDSLLAIECEVVGCVPLAHWRRSEYVERLMLYEDTSARLDKRR